MIVEGALVIMDLDSFGDTTIKRGYSEYVPNEITGTLTMLVESFVRKWRGVILYGLSRERGTEEAVIEIPYVRAEELAEDLVMIAKEICRLGSSISIVAVTGPVAPRLGRSRREAYTGTPLRRSARRILERLKRSGGGAVYIDGVIVWSRRSKRS